MLRAWREGRGPPRLSVHPLQPRNGGVPAEQSPAAGGPCLGQAGLKGSLPKTARELFRISKRVLREDGLCVGEGMQNNTYPTFFWPAARSIKSLIEKNITRSVACEMSQYNVLSPPTSSAGRSRARHWPNVYIALLQVAGVRYSPFHRGFTGGSFLAFHDRPYIQQQVLLYGDPATSSWFIQARFQLAPWREMLPMVLQTLSKGNASVTSWEREGISLVQAAVASNHS